MCLRQGQNQELYVGAGVFLTSLFLYIIICNVGLAGKTGPRTLSAPGLSSLFSKKCLQSTHLINPYSEATLLWP